MLELLLRLRETARIEVVLGALEIGGGSGFDAVEKENKPRDKKYRDDRDRGPRRYRGSIFSGPLA